MEKNKFYKNLVLNKVHWDMASALAEEQSIFKGSHRGEAANVVGCLGEVATEALFLKYNIEFMDHRERTDYDYVVGSKLTIDVKTKDRTVHPKKDYDNSVPLYNHEHQRPDYYLFISLLRDKSKPSVIENFTNAFIVGGISLERLDNIGKHWKAGEVDPSNKTKFWTDCLNVYMEDLTPVHTLLERWK